MAWFVRYPDHALVVGLFDDTPKAQGDEQYGRRFFGGG